MRGAIPPTLSTKRPRKALSMSRNEIAQTLLHAKKGPLAGAPCFRKSPYAWNSTAPLVKPPPKPTSTTLSPGWMRPSS